MVAEIRERSIAPAFGGNGLSLSHALPSPSDGQFSLRRPFQIVSLLEMLHEYGYTFFLMTEKIVRFEERLKSIDADQVIEGEVKKRLTEAYTVFQKPCVRLGLNSTDDQLKRIIEEIKKEGVRYDTLKGLIPELRRRLYDDVKRVEFIHVPANRIDHYRDLPQFGTDVADKFPKAIEDIQESAKCFALGRYTASVFHLMRVMEFAVQQLGKKLSIVLVSEKNWHNILDEVDRAIKALPITTSYQKTKRNKFAESSAHLRMVKDAWRNDVMHPKATYTEEEAERIFRNVRDFMVHLATKL